MIDKYKIIIIIILIIILIIIIIIIITMIIIQMGSLYAAFIADGFYFFIVGEWNL